MDCKSLVEGILRDEKAILRALRETGASEWLKLDLTMSQLKALFALDRSGPLPVGGLGQTLVVGLPAASALVDRLVQHGLVERNEDPADRRRTVVRLTTAGEQLTGRLREGGREQMREWIGRLDESDLIALARGTKALAEVVAHNREAAQEAVGVDQARGPANLSEPQG